MISNQNSQPTSSSTFQGKGRIGNTLTIMFIVMSVLTIGLLATVSIWVGQNSMQSIVFDELEARATLHEQFINAWLEERQQDLKAVILSPVQLNLTRQLLGNSSTVSSDLTMEHAVLQQMFQLEIAQDKVFEEFFIINLEGKTIFSTEPTEEGKIHRGKSYFQNGLIEDFISPPLYNLVRKESGFIMTSPIKDGEGQVMGVLAGYMNFIKVEELIKQVTELSETSETYLVGQNQDFLTKPNQEPPSRKAHTLGVELALTPGPDRRGQAIYDNYNGVTVAGAYRWLPQLESVLLTEVPTAEAFTGVTRLIWVNGIAAVAILLLAIGGASYITPRIVDPIVTLTEAAISTAQGNIKIVSVDAPNEIGILADVFNTMTSRLSSSIGLLESRVKERTAALEASVRISREMTSFLDRSMLVQFVVNQIQQIFEFYYVQIYLIDAETEDLILVEGTGTVGAALKERNHFVPVGKGIVGTVASTNEPFLSNDVRDSLNFLPNDLLPNTASELAVPLRKGEQVLGVLDIQSEVVNRFTREDMSTLQAIANQVAIMLDNIRLLEDARKSAQEVRRLNQRLTHEGWDHTLAEVPHRAYQFINGEKATITPVENTWLSAAQKSNGQEDANLQTIPLVLRGQVIGKMGIKRQATAKWTTEEIEAIRSVANQTALALESARLSQEQEKTIIKLQEVDRLKSEFLTSMSHELRTPLNSIIGFADILLQGIDGPLTEHALTDITAIHNSGKHLLNLINDLLDLSKIEAGRMELACSILSVPEMFSDVAATSSSLLTNKPVDLVFDLPDEIAQVWADPLRLSQILLNLVSNAIKFTEKGTVTLAAKMNLDDMVEISVTDTGIGIPADKFGLVFEHFRQVDARTNRKFQGTGMGLAIAKQLVELHGGKMWLTSVEGQGTTFFFTIPVAIEETLAAH